MGLFGFNAGPNINEAVKECRSTEGAVLLDVRGRDEYAEGHIPGGVNLPLPEIEQIGSVVPDKDTPLFVHCLSGGRSGQAVSYLKRAGYTNVRNIGGIAAWTGEQER